MRIKTISFWMLIGIALGLIVFFASGCTEKQIQAVDQAAEVGQAVVDSGQAVLDSPGGQMIPVPIRSVAEVTGAGILSLIALWKSQRAKITSVVLKSVVRAVDKSTASDSVKPAVKANLQAAGVEKEGRAIIQSMKV